MTIPTGRSLIADLLPSWVTVAESRQDVGEDHLFPSERRVIINAVGKRRAEFSTVRACARHALAELGLPPSPILPGLRGAPGWPDGVIGSMTHCAGYRAAAVARNSQGVSLGIDAEPHEAVPDGVLDMVALPAEQTQLAQLNRVQPDFHWDRLLFSMKESVYKTWFPLTGLWLDFEQAELRIDAERQTFAAELLVPGPVVRQEVISSFAGRFAVRDGLVLTAIAIAADGAVSGTQ